MVSPLTGLQQQEVWCPGLDMRLGVRLPGFKSQRGHFPGE